MHILYYATDTLDRLYNLFSRTIIILVLCRKLAADASNSYGTCQIQYISVRQPVRTIADYGRLYGRNMFFAKALCRFVQILHSRRSNGVMMANVA